MTYSTPVLSEVGKAATLVLGFLEGVGDNSGSIDTLPPALALGLDE